MVSRRPILTRIFSLFSSSSIWLNLNLIQNCLVHSLFHISQLSMSRSMSRISRKFSHHLICSITPWIRLSVQSLRTFLTIKSVYKDIYQKNVSTKRFCNLCYLHICDFDNTLLHAQRKAYTSKPRRLWNCKPLCEILLLWQEYLQRYIHKEKLQLNWAHQNIARIQDLIRAPIV